MNRYLAIRSIRAKLKSKELSLGSWMQLPNGSVAEIMGQSGYDWVALDLEHGSFSCINSQICSVLWNLVAHYRWSGLRRKRERA